MNIAEHKRRAEVYRSAAEKHYWIADGMCIAISGVLYVDWDGSEMRPFRRELAKEVGRLDKFHKRMNGYFDKYGCWAKCPHPDRELIRGEILTRAAEYHEACVQAGRTL